MVRRLLLLLDIVPGPLKVLWGRELHHSADELAVVGLHILGEASDEVLLEAGSVVRIFGLLVTFLARGRVFEAVVHLDHVYEFELGEAHDADVLDHDLQRLELPQLILLVQLQTLQNRLVGLVVDAVDHLALEDLDAFKVEFVALCAHGVALNDHERAEDPMVEAGVSVDPPCSPRDQLVGAHALGHRDAVVYLLREGDEIALIDLEVGLLEILVLLVVGDDELRVVHDLVGLAVGLREALVVYVQGPALEEVVIQLLLQLLVGLERFEHLRVGRPLLFRLSLALRLLIQHLLLRSFHY